MKDNFPRTALNCRNLSCNNTMKTGDIYIDGFCGRCYENQKKGREALNKLVDMEVNDKGVVFKMHEGKYYNEIINTGYRFEVRKTIQALDKVDMAIREKRFPILYITKEQTAVIIPIEEYETLIKCRDTLHLAQINKLMNRG